MRKIVPISVVVFLLVTPFMLADTAWPSISCNDCQFVFGEQGYCQQNVCYERADDVVIETEQPIITQPPPQDLTLLEQKIAFLEKSLTSLQEHVNQLSNTVQNIDTQQQVILENVVVSQEDITEIQQQLEGRVNNIATGLAAVQKDLETIERNTAKGEAFTRFVIWALIIILVAGVTAGIIVYVSKEKKPELNQEIVAYITKHIKQGKKFTHIKQTLLDAGWPEKDINWAYKETMKSNYQNYLNKKTRIETAFDKNKMIFIAVFSLLVIIGAFFIIRGVTGQAAHFQTEEQFSLNVRNMIENNIRNNQFYALIHDATFCVEVNNDDYSASYKITKTPFGHTIDRAEKSCSSDIRYDAAVQFSDFKSFREVTNDMSCEMLREKHSDDMHVLPSRLILPGFRMNPTVDYSEYCPVLRKCLTPSELRIVGC